MLPEPLQQLKRHFQNYPGVGPRQAERFAFALMKQPPEEVERAIAALTAISQSVLLCTSCNMPAEKNKEKLCDICRDPKRSANVLCVVEKEGDVLNMEKANVHAGRYFVLGDNISPLHTTGLAKDRVRALLKRLRGNTAKHEVILALGNTREGNFTSMYLQESLKKLGRKNVTVTRLGRGLATGTDLEYADEETLRNAIEGRR
ncbi:MAG: recombination mediator RecR [Candidatus Spechtbacterales bacterium]